MEEKTIKLIEGITDSFDCKSGYYAKIFLNYENKTVIKVFKSDETFDHCKNVYESEVKAYKLAESKEELKPYIPIFYGQEPSIEIFSKNGENISEKYFCDFNYKIELVEGEERKFGTITGDAAHYFPKLFLKAGINYYKDSSVFLDDKGNIKKFIDFATQEYELIH